MRLEIYNFIPGDAAQWWDGGGGVGRASWGDATGRNDYDYGEHDRWDDDFNGDIDDEETLVVWVGK